MGRGWLWDTHLNWVVLHLNREDERGTACPYGGGRSGTKELDLIMTMGRTAPRYDVRSPRSTVVR